MSEFRLIGEVKQTEVVGAGGVTIKPGQVSDLVNPSLEQIDVYNPENSYKKGEYALIKEGSKYAIFQALTDTTGEFNKEAWTRYSLGSELSSIRTDLEQTTNDLMLEIAKGMSGSPNQTSGVLAWESSDSEQFTNAFNPFLGLLENGYKTYKGISINRSVIPVDVNQTIDLGKAPAVGTEYDFVFLEAFRTLLNGAVTFTTRLRSFPLTELEYRRAKASESYFLGLSQLRPRFVQAQGNLAQPLEEEVSIDPSSNAYRFATFLSADERKDAPVGQAIEVEDKGLWIAGDGSEESKKALQTADGYSYGIPLVIVKRRNASPVSRTNVNGAAEYKKFEQVVPNTDQLLPGIQFYVTGVTADQLVEGEEFYFNTIANENLVRYTGQVDAFQRPLFSVVGLKPITVQSANTLVSHTSNQYGLYNNIIVKKDIIAINKTITTGISHYDELLDSMFNKLMRGELLDKQEEDVTEVFTSPTMEKLNWRDNLVPVYTAKGQELINRAGQLMSYKSLLRYTGTAIQVRETNIDDEGWHTVQVSVPPTIGSDIIGVFPISQDKQDDQSRYLMAVQIESPRSFRISGNTNPVNKQEGTTDVIWSTKESGESFDGNIYLTLLETQSGLFEFRYRNLRFYEIDVTETVTTNLIKENYYFVENKPKKVQNFFKPVLTSPNITSVTEGIMNVTIPTSEEYPSVLLGQWTTALNNPLIDLTVSPKSQDVTSFTLMMEVKLPSFDTMYPVIWLTDYKLKYAETIRIVQPFNEYLKEAQYIQLSIVSNSCNVDISDVRVMPSFASTSQSISYGTHEIGNDEESFVYTHALDVFDRYRKSWSNRPSSSVVRRTISPVKMDNESDIVLKQQEKNQLFATDDQIQLNSKNVIGPVVNHDVLANASRVLAVSGNVVTLTNVTDLAVGDKVNIYNPYTMNIVASNVVVASVTSSTNSITVSTNQPINPGYLVLETLTTPFIPSLDDFVEGSWVDINTRNPLLKLNNLLPPAVSNNDPVTPVDMTDFNKVFDSQLDLPKEVSQWASISSGGKFTVAIQKNGTLWAWGDNQYGQLGDGTTTDRYVPVQIGTDTDWNLVACGTNHTMALKGDGSLWAWGWNGNGRLGDGTAVDKNVPTRIGLDTDWALVDAGLNFSLALKKNGTLWAWGSNDNGQLSRGPEVVSTSKPMKVDASTDWASIACGSSHSVALKSDGTLWTWGYNYFGQLGDGGSTIKYTTTKVGTDIDWAKISAGTNHTAALKKDGTIWTWGENGSGQLGDGTTTLKRVPTKIGTDKDWMTIVCGANHTISLKTDNSLWIWGYNNMGAVGDGTTGNKLTPTKIGTDTDWTNPDGGSSNTVALKKNGTLWAWGFNDKGQLGLNNTLTVLIPTQVKNYMKTENGDSGVKSIAGGGSFTIALKKDGTLWGWGRNHYGQLGDATGITRRVPTQIGVDANWTSIACGGDFAMALKKDGTLWGWGYNGSAQVGDGTTTTKTIPTKIGTDTNWASIACGASHTLAIKEDGTLWAWGYNGSGQLGDGGSTPSYRPIKIGSDSDWASVSGGNSHTVALKKDGTLWAWGYNSYGQLGDGTTISSPSPKKIGTDTNWVGVSAGISHTVALKKDGTLWAWGYNSYGQLGDGTTVQKLTPTRIGTDIDWTSIHTSLAHHTMALKKDGSLWAWGWNGNYQLGNGTVTDIVTPTKIGTDTDWSYMSCSSSTTIGLKKDGTLWGWGLNSNSQTGTGSTNTNVYVITKIGTDTDWGSPYIYVTIEETPYIKDIKTGQDHSVALKSDGTIWSWGYNGYGQLGNKTLSNSYTPVQSGTDTDWKAISCGSGFTLALKKDGTIWAWGQNQWGQLGSGSTNSLALPVKIGTDTDWDSIACGHTHSVAIKKDGTLWVWGYNSTIGYLGIGSTGSAAITTPTRINTDTDWSSVACGYVHTIALKKDGSLWGWGSNTYFQVGDGTTTGVINRPMKIGTSTDWSSLACGTSYSIALKKDGTLWAWGINDYGQLGNGSTSNSGVSVPTKIGSSTDWSSVYARFNQTMAIKKDGTLWAWGQNQWGQLGLGTSSSSFSPTSPTKIGSDADWKSIGLGGSHTLALKNDGTTWAWGRNQYGELTDALPTGVYFPQQILKDTPEWQVDVGQTHSVALKKDGTIWAWGRNYYGPLGDGTTIDKSIPTKIGNDNDWAFIACGGDFTIALKKDGTLWGWGQNSNYQLGDGTKTNKLVPAKIGTDTDWTTVSCGSNHTLALKRDGTLWSWGYNASGQIGNGTTNDWPVPAKVGTATDWAVVAAGGSVSMALNKDGDLFAWGLNGNYQLGDGTSANRTLPAKVWAAGVFRVAIGKTSSAAIKKDGTLWTWGTGANGELGSGTSGSTAWKATPYSMDNANDWISINTGYGSYSIIGMKKDGSLWAWGANDAGQLGDGTTSLKTRPNRIGLDNDWSSAVVANNALAVKKDGSLWAWGSNIYGQSGNGTKVNLSVPTLIIESSVKKESSTYKSWTMISSGSDHTVALKKDGTLWAWGRNTYGQLGDGSAIDKYIPVKIGTDDKWASVATGNSYTVALRMDGTIWTWGYNSWGQLGDGTTSTTNKNKPVKMGTYIDWAAIACGGNHTLALKLDGTLWAWGYNDKGQLGNGNTTYQTLPVKIGTDTDWSMIKAGGSFSLALKKDGSLWAWGDNQYGALGDGTNIDKNIPTKIGTDTDWQSISNGRVHSMAIKNNGTLWAWGHNGNGQVGDGSSVNLNTPTQVGTDTNWTSVMGGQRFTLALKTDGSLWAWGTNSNGQLGDGTKNDTYLPKRIGLDNDWSFISCGQYFAVGIKSDTSLWTWGYNTYGNLGNGTTTNIIAPPNKLELKILAGSSNGDNLIVLKTDGTLWGIGGNLSGELGLGHTNPCYEYTQIGTDIDWKAVSCGLQHTLALKTDGTLWAWGNNSNGQLGNGTTTTSLYPIQIGTLTTWTAISASQDSSLCAGIAGGTAYYWGQTNIKAPTVASPAGKTITKISVGQSHLLMTTSFDNYLYTFGIGSFGELGRPEGDIATAVQVTTDAWSSVREIKAIGNVSFVTDAKGDLYACGAGGTGAFIDSTVNKATFEKVPITGKVTRIMGSDLNNGAYYAETENGIVAWGKSSKLGVGDDGVVPAPLKFENDKGPVIVDILSMNLSNSVIDIWGNIWMVGSSIYIKRNTKLVDAFRAVLKNVQTASTGVAHSIAIKKDGTLWSWGSNNYGQLGDGTTSAKSVPTKIGTDIDWTSVICGGYHTVALKTDGTIWSWGRNNRGQLGDGTTSDKSVPTKIGTDTDWTSITSSDYHIVALKKDGSLWTWGYNLYGQLGDGTTSAKSVPTKIGTDTDWMSISAGNSYTVALKKDGSLWAWGNNASGYLGDGTTTSKLIPTKIGTDIDWTSITCGMFHTIALKKDGSIWSWGSNVNGGLGLDDITIGFRSVPTRIGTDTDWTTISAGYYHTIALKTDGSLWTWGYNNHGQLGFDGYDTMYAPYKTTKYAKKIASAIDYRTFIIDSQDTLWGVGKNVDGALGKPINPDMTLVTQYIKNPFTVEYRELYRRSSGLKRFVKDVSSITINDRPLQEKNTFSAYVPLDISTSFTSSDDKATSGSSLVSGGDNSYVINNVADYLFTNVSIPVEVYDRILSSNLRDMKQTYLDDMAIQFTALSTDANITIKILDKTFNLVKDVPQLVRCSVKSLLNDKNDLVYPLVQFGQTGESFGSGVTIINPVFEYKIKVPKRTNQRTFVPNDIVVTPSANNKHMIPLSFEGKIAGDIESNPHVITIKDGTNYTEVSTVFYNNLQSDWVDTSVEQAPVDGEVVNIKLNPASQTTMPVNRLRETSKILHVKFAGYVVSSTGEKLADMELMVRNQSTGAWQNMGVSEQGISDIPLDGTTSTTYINEDGIIELAGFIKGQPTITNKDRIRFKIDEITYESLDEYNYDHTNVVHVNAEDGSVELEWNPTNALGQFDSIDVRYVSTPKLQPIYDTDDTMVILTESEHVLVTDIGDVLYIDQGENPYISPLSQFDHDFNDLLGIIGYDGLMFTADSIKTNIDSLVRLQDGLMVGASQQRAVKSYNTPVAAISRSLVYYKGMVQLMVTIVKSTDGVIDTQNGHITRYLVPIEGNVYIPEPKSVKRQTIRNKKIWN